MNASARMSVIVGNGFAGTTCAEQLRKADPACSIVLFTDESYCLYNRISLPPFLRRQIPEAKVMMRDVAWHEKMNIELHLSTRVDRIDAIEKVAYADGTGYPYDALLVATGGRPNPCPTPGAQGAANVYNFQYMDDTKAISQQLETAKAAVAIGGSFIGYELAEAFASRGVETHWVQRGPRFLRRMLDEIAGEMIDEAARGDGVHVHYGEELKEVVRSNGVVTKVITTGGVAIPCGCAAEFYDPTAEMYYRMGTWNNAGAHGKVAAANMAGGDVRYHDVPEYSSKLFTEQTITQFGISPEYRTDLEMVRKIDREKKHYRALFFWQNRLAGCVMIGKGNRAGKRKYVEAIKSKKAFAPDEWELMLDWTAD